MADVDSTLAALKAAGDDTTMAATHKRLSAARDALSDATDWVVATMPTDAAAGAAPSALYLKLFGITAGGWMMARSALAAKDGSEDAEYLKAKMTTVRHYADHILSQAPALTDAITADGETVMSFAIDQF